MIESGLARWADRDSRVLNGFVCMVRLGSRSLLPCLVLLVVGCRSGEPTKRDAARAFNDTRSANEGTTAPGWPPRDWWRGCRSDVECDNGHVCMAVDPRPKQAILVASLLEPKACALVVSPDLRLHDGPSFARNHLEQLLFLPEISLSLSGTICTLKGCGGREVLQPMQRGGGEAARLLRSRPRRSRRLARRVRRSHGLRAAVLSDVVGEPHQQTHARGSIPHRRPRVGLSARHPTPPAELELTGYLWLPT